MTDYQEDQLRRLRAVCARPGQDGRLGIVARQGVSLDETPPVGAELQELGLVRVWRNDDAKPSFIYVAPVD
jgi:hypothetical protein